MGFWGFGVTFMILDSSRLLRQTSSHLNILMEMKYMIKSQKHMEHILLIHQIPTRIHMILLLTLGSNHHLHHCILHLGIQLEVQTLV